MPSTDFVNIEISEIAGYHPAIAHLAAQLVDHQFTTAISNLSDYAANRFLTLHPICINRYRGKNYIVGGFRSYQIAVLKFGPDSQVRCRLINSRKEIQDIAKIDILFSPLVFSLSTKVAQQTERLVGIVGRDFANEHHADLASVRAFTRVHERS
ncbi:hypothetical protein [Alishewanella longhuensis]